MKLFCSRQSLFGKSTLSICFQAKRKEKNVRKYATYRNSFEKKNLRNNLRLWLACYLTNIHSSIMEPINKNEWDKNQR